MNNIIFIPDDDLPLDADVPLSELGHIKRAVEVRRIDYCGHWSLSSPFVMLLEHWDAGGCSGCRIPNPLPLHLQVALRIRVVTAVCTKRIGAQTAILQNVVALCVVGIPEHKRVWDAKIPATNVQ